MKTTYQAEGTKIYYNLMINALFKGDYQRSNYLLNEYLTMFPDLVEEFYELFEPVMKNIANIDIRGGQVM